MTEARQKYAFLWEHINDPDMVKRDYTQCTAWLLGAIGGALKGEIKPIEDPALKEALSTCYRLLRAVDRDFHNRKFEDINAECKVAYTAVRQFIFRGWLQYVVG